LRHSISNETYLRMINRKALAFTEQHSLI